MAIKFGRPIESRTPFTPVEPNPAAKDEQLDLSVRMRRNRRTSWSRALVRETTLQTSDLIWPLFVIEGRDKVEPVASMPGVERHSVDRIVQKVEEAAELGIPAIALFPNTPPGLRTPDGREAFNPDTKQWERRKEMQKAK